MKALRFKKNKMAGVLMGVLKKGLTCSELCGVDSTLLSKVESNHPHISKQVERVLM